MATQTDPSKKKSHDIQDITPDLLHIFANTFILYVKTRNYHWNVTGPNFFSLHRMFEEQANDLHLGLDILAEHLRILKITVPATLPQLIKLSSLNEEKDIPIARNMLKDLMHDHEIVAHQIHLLKSNALKFQEYSTVDILNERRSAHEKAAWMLRSTLELG